MGKYLINLLENKKEEYFDKFVFYICVIDHLFLPYVWFITVPYSLPIILIWLLKRYSNIKQNKEFLLFKLMFAFMIISTVYGIVITPQYSYKNIVYLIQFTCMFLYYFMYLDYLARYNFRAKYILVAFMVFIVILAILYNMDKSLYHNIKLFWNRRSGISTFGKTNEGFEGYRYSFIWMDDNNVGYMMNALVLYLWCNEKSSFLIKICSLCSLLLVLISCMSNGAVIAFGISIGLYLITTIIRINRMNKHKKYLITPLKIFLALASIIIVYVIITKIPDYMKTSIVRESLERMKSNSGESRIIIWRDTISKMNFVEYILIGKGGITIVDGYLIAPHNGHLYWILAYGFISYVIFMYFLFYKRKITKFREYIFIIPIFFGFTINVLLGEIKMMGIILLLIACSTSSKYLAIPKNIS